MPPGAILPLAFQGTLEVTVVNLNSHFYEFLQVIRRLRPRNLILYPVLLSLIVLSFESLIVLASLVCILLEDRRVASSRSSLL